MSRRDKCCMCKDRPVRQTRVSTSLMCEECHLIVKARAVMPLEWMQKNPWPALPQSNEPTKTTKQ